MPWAPELFSARVLARLEEQRQHKLVDVPLWDGLMTGELDALIGSFAGQPEVHHPVRGRIRGAQEFGAFVTELNAWFGRRHVSVEEVDGVAAQRHGFDEVILHLDGTTGRIGLPVATVADKRFDRRIKELRIYYSTRPLTAAMRPAHRCCSRIRSYASQMSSPIIRTRWPPATSRRSWQRSNPAHTPASLRAAGTSTEATMAYARSTSSYSRMAAESRWSIAQ
jgi:hypothetical protein